MKQVVYIVSLCFLFFGCSNQKRKSSDQSSDSKTNKNGIKLHELRKLFVIGDFDGDGKRDTIFQHNYSKRYKAEIKNSADPFQNDWDTVAKWFYDQEAEVYLTLNKNNPDTLSLGPAQGLYCLINIGDLNSDAKDEIACVVDYLDESRVNSCKIYSLCHGTWSLMKQFGIHEDAFNFTPGKAPVFTSIKEYLEIQKGKWVYKDYLQDGYENEEDVGKMMTLHIGKCD